MSELLLLAKTKSKFMSEAEVLCKNLDPLRIVSSLTVLCQLAEQHLGPGKGCLKKQFVLEASKYLKLDPVIASNSIEEALAVSNAGEVKRVSLFDRLKKCFQ